MNKLLMAFVLISIGFTQTADAQEFRARIRERIQERVQERLAERQSSATNNEISTQDNEIRVNGRKVIYHIPQNVRPNPPLILAFHGGGGFSEHMANDQNYGLISASEKYGFIVAFPNGTGAVGEKFATWNAGGCCGKARDEQINDVAFAKQIVTEIVKKTGANRARVYAIGMSNGGMMSHKLACDAADTFKAIASVAGTDATASCTPSQPISILHIHALNDDHVLYNGGAGPNAFRDTSKVMNFRSVDQTINNWKQRNSCGPQTTQILNVPGARCDVNYACQDGVRVQLCTTETGGHSWPGASKVRNGKETPSQVINANDVIWSFFENLELKYR